MGTAHLTLYYKQLNDDCDDSAYISVLHDYYTTYLQISYKLLEKAFDNVEVKANTSSNTLSYKYRVFFLVVKITYEYYAVQKTWDFTCTHFFTKRSYILHYHLLRTQIKEHRE
jgi:hypothetical protein